MRRSKDRSIFIALCVAPAAILFFIFMVMPTFNVFRMSLFERGAYSPTETFVGLNNFKVLFKDVKFITSMQNTILLIVTVTIITFFFAIVFAAILNPGRLLLRLGRLLALFGVGLRLLAVVGGHGPLGQLHADAIVAGLDDDVLIRDLDNLSNNTADGRDLIALLQAAAHLLRLLFRLFSGRIIRKYITASMTTIISRREPDPGAASAA